MGAYEADCLARMLGAAGDMPAGGRSAGKKRKRKRSVLRTVFISVFFLVGGGLIAYPTFSDWWNKLHNSRAIAGYEQQVEDMSAEELQKMWSDAETYNAYLRMAPDRFHPEEEIHMWYSSLLNTDGSGLMGYVEIPDKDILLPVYHGTGEGTLQVAAGHLEGTSLPIGGEGVHAVVSGHNGLPSARLFTDITKMEEGDLFRVSVLGEDMWYEVYGMDTVEPGDMSYLAIEDGEDLVTLITCVPYGVNSHRLLVYGRRTDRILYGG